MEIDKVDALKWVRERPRQFFPSSVVEAIHVIAYLMADVIELGCGTCVIRRFEHWWFVGSDVNWMQHEVYPVRELFNHVVPAPAHGEHSMRGEVLVMAFAKDVCVLLRNELVQIKGDDVPSPQVLQYAKGFECSVMLSL